MDIEVDIVAGPGELEALEPLWIALHRHHRTVVPSAAMLVDDDSLSWSRRRDLYRTWMTAATRSCSSLAELERPWDTASPTCRTARLTRSPSITRYAELHSLFGAASFRSSWSSGASGRPETTRAAQWAARSPGIGSLAADL